jgi:Flp pilus assembly protein TadG
VGGSVRAPMRLETAASVRGHSRSFSFLRSLRRLFRSGERGTAVVEFALVSVPLFLILLGIMDFGRALDYYNSITQLSGQGARAAAVNQNPDGAPANGNFQTTLKGMSSITESTSRLQVCLSGKHADGTTWTGNATAPLKAGDNVTVQTTYRFHFLPMVRGVDLTLKATQTERFEAVSSTSLPGCTP